MKDIEKRIERLESLTRGAISAGATGYAVARWADAIAADPDCLAGTAWDYLADPTRYREAIERAAQWDALVLSCASPRDLLI